jgi:hypothetical protein
MFDGFSKATGVLFVVSVAGFMTDASGNDPEMRGLL